MLRKISPRGNSFGRERCCRRLSPLVLSLALLCAAPNSPVSASSAQGKQATEERKKPSKPELESHGPQKSEEQQKGYSIGVNVDLVVVHTSVYDKNGHFVSGLKKENFKVFEDGIAQALTSFSQEDVPVSMGILIDTSGSMRSKIEMVNKAALALIRASNPQDEVFLIGFSDEVELLEDYTNDIDLISDSLDNIVVTGGTALYDAIHLGVQKAEHGTKPKKAVIVITDGEDRDSYYKLEELLAKVQEADAQVYCIGFTNPLPDKGLFDHWSKSVPEKAREALQKIAEETGGKAFFPEKTPELGNIVSTIAHELRSQYSIGFVSSNKARDGAWRRLRIVLDGPNTTTGHHVRARTGYFSPKVAEASKTQ